MAGETEDYSSNTINELSLFNGSTWESARSVLGAFSGGPNSVGRLAVSEGLPPVQFLSGVNVSTTSASSDTILCAAKFCMAVTLAFSVAPTSISTQLQGSFDNSNWFNIGSPITSVVAGTTAVAVTDFPVRYTRVATTITGGTGVNVTAWVGVVI